MKKLAMVVLAIVLCMSLLACGGSDTSNPGKEDPKQENQQHEKDNVETTQGEAQDEFGVRILTKEEALPYVTKVTLTMDNWKDYFANQTEPYHIKRTNEFGDVTMDLDFLYLWFGATFEHNDVVQLKDVAFKFSRYVEYYEEGDGGDGKEKYGCWDRIVNEDGTAKLGRYPYGTEPQEKDWDDIDPPAEGYYLAKPVSKDENRKHYFDCLGVTGEIYLLDLPDEMWTKLEDKNEFGYMHLVPLSILISEEKGMEVVRIGDEYFFRHTDKAENLHTVLEP